MDDGIGDVDLHLFGEGTHLRAWRALGAHPTIMGKKAGTRFAVWAPNAESVSVIGTFNEWRPGANRLVPRGASGIFEGFVPGVTKGAAYKYRVRSRVNGYEIDKADPYGFHHQTPPETASVVWDLAYEWRDSEWMRTRGTRQSLNAPISIYEVHLGSWMRVPEEENRSLTYREIAGKLAEHCAQMGFTHVEFLPVMEHPFYGSWGYQVTGYFAPTSRYGTPQDFMYLVDTLHQRGIGVIIDWVPSHFPSDAHGLGFFDGTALYEHADARQGFHPDWKSSIFNFGRHEVKSFLLSSAHFWLDVFHADALRVDAVASMLYLDYSRKEGEWIPNAHGGRENLDAVAFLKALNESVYREHPDAQTIAEESTSWPAVSRPLYLGGLGFGFKWDMGWMHDTLSYFQKDPVHRRYHHRDVTFRMMYAFYESFVLPLSHDEVVHGKGSLLGKMPGDDWQAFANLRLLYAWQTAQPGKKLLFMGAELAQRAEWNHDQSLDWHLLKDPRHDGVRKALADLNRVYRDERALHELDCDAAGFEWIDCNDADGSVVALLRRGKDPDDVVCAVFNFTPVPHSNRRVGVPFDGFWEEIFNSDAADYGGAGWGNLGGVEAAPVPIHGRRFSLSLTLPPLGAVFLRGRRAPA